MDKLIITAAICGAEVTKEQNPSVPYTIEELAEESFAAYKAGASILHLHVREDDGTPTQNKDRFKQATDAIRRRCPDVIIQPSTGGAVGMSDAERLQSTEVEETRVQLPHPEMATLDCGSCNFGGDDVFINSDKTIENFAWTMLEWGIKPEIEVFDKGMIDKALRLAKQGYLRSPIHFNFVMGVQIGATARDLTFMVDSLPPGSSWTVSGIGKHQVPMAALGIVMGGHVRVGFEDNIYIEKGHLAASNGNLVAKVAKLAEELNRPVASPPEAREILNLSPLQPES